MIKNKPLKPKQNAALRLLAQGESHKFVAEILNVSAMTVYRWGCIPEFQAQLKTITASETGLEVTARRLSAAVLTAIETTQETMCNMREPVELRLKAAQIILRSMPPASAALEKALRHRMSDFLLEQRFDGGNTYDSAGNEIPKFNHSNCVRSESGGIVV
ncbi:MAG: helix-turn-helix domain-containing protein [Gallionella sp.]